MNEVLQNLKRIVCLSLCLFLLQTAQAQFSLVKDINTIGGGSSSPQNFAIMGSYTYFAADDAGHGSELWRTDGTLAGTTLVADINPGPGASAPTNLCVVGSTLYFSANDGTNGAELWKSDGTAGGTSLVKDINSGATGSSPTSLCNGNGTLFFAATDGTNGIELWKSDGTSGGTVLVKDINTGATSSSPTLITALGSIVLFDATDATHGTEIWKSDGTSGGTVLVKDLDPVQSGTTTPLPSDFVVLGSYMYFFGFDPATTNSYGFPGRNLMRTDGTAANTVAVYQPYMVGSHLLRSRQSPSAA
jgi:ELWxxDGT repeat protein